MQKKIFVILSSLLISIIGFSQSVINRTFGTNTVNDPRLSATINLLAPRYLDTTAANLQIGVDSCGALIYTYSNKAYWFRDCSPKRWVKLLKSGDDDNTYIKNQFTAVQTPGRLWVDSARFGNLIISARPSSTTPSLFSQNHIWYMAQNVRHFFSSSGSGNGNSNYAMLFFTTFSVNQPNKYSGVITGFNFTNTGSSNKPFVIATSGLNSLRAGDIIISPGRGLVGDTITETRVPGNWHVILDPANSGEVQVTAPHVINLLGGLKLKDSVSSATTITITSAAIKWSFTGSSTATWTLPVITGNAGLTFWIKNKGSADIVLTAATNTIYSSSATTTFNITPGEAYMVSNDGTHWSILNN